MLIFGKPIPPADSFFEWFLCGDGVEGGVVEFCRLPRLILLLEMFSNVVRLSSSPFCSWSRAAFSSEVEGASTGGWDNLEDGDGMRGALVTLPESTFEELGDSGSPLSFPKRAAWRLGDLFEGTVLLR